MESLLITIIVLQVALVLACIALRFLEKPRKWQPKKQRKDTSAVPSTEHGQTTMVGRTTPPTIGELGQMLGLLTKYYDYLLYEASEGMRLDEDPRDTEYREIAINRISDCIDTVKDDLQYRLENY